MPKTKKTHDLKALLANSFLPTLKLSTQFSLCFALIFITFWFVWSSTIIIIVVVIVALVGVMIIT